MSEIAEFGNAGLAGLEPKLKSSVPPEIRATLASALTRRRGKYTDMRKVYYCICIDEGHWVGVAGDGGNASYENFSLKPDGFECSDCGYGDTVVALRDILVKEVR